jgi:two-component system, chemotaxis family, sensor kinase CheA
MMPLSTIFNTFNRTIRDMSRSMSKNITYTGEGGETELDKKMIEKLGDPLMHMIRNAIDHGIESPEIRLAKGKPETGTINLSAGYEGGTVVIKLQDDGAGISKERLQAKALEKNLYNEDTLREMSDKEIYDLIFHPGFSTSKTITDISGRGVGMDVVKRNIVVDLKGSIQIETVYGQGTAFCIRLPLTLSIMSVLLIKSSGMIFALSSNSVSEVLRVPETDLIDVMNRKAIRLRGLLIPIAPLNNILNVPHDTSIQRKRKINLVIILQMGEEQLGLIVDSLISEEDMVIKPLPSHMNNNEWVTGIAITGKNELVNVLHIPMLFSNSSKAINNKSTDIPLQIAHSNELKRILVVDDSFNTRELEKKILETGGYVVDTAEDGEEGLNLAKQTQYNLIVTDCDMPKMNGFELTENLRKDQYYIEKPIIIVTAKDREEDRLKGMKAGANAYITKATFDQKILLETVDSLIG